MLILQLFLALLFGFGGGGYYGRERFGGAAGSLIGLAIGLLLVWICYLCGLRL